MTLSIQGDYTNGTAADGSEVTTEFNYIYTGINTHAAASPADHPNGSINADLLATNAVTTVKINADAVTGAKIADDAVDSEHIADGAIDTAHIAASQITTAKCAAGVAGYHGFLTRMKLLPSDFITDQQGLAPFCADKTGAYFKTKTDAGVAATATVNVPSGYKATEIMIYAEDATNECVAYSCLITDGTTADSLISDTTHFHPNTAITASTTPALNPFTASATNYLTISVGLGAGDKIYGGYVTIAEV
jgi:hypothetical protein